MYISLKSLTLKQIQHQQQMLYHLVPTSVALKSLAGSSSTWTCTFKMKRVQGVIKLKTLKLPWFFKEGIIIFNVPVVWVGQVFSVFLFLVQEPTLLLFASPHCAVLTVAHDT